MRLAGLLAAFVLAACSSPNRVDPVTGRAYSSSLPGDFASQDAYIRANHLTELTLAQDGGELNEPEIAAACNDLLARIVAAVPDAHRRGFTYRLHLTASPGINAYTYGGGRIHCHLGLLAVCRDGAELAATLAHEVGHNSHDHVGQQLGRQERAANVLGFGGLLGRPGEAIGNLIGGYAARLILFRFSRQQEREADDRAVDYTVAAGIDPDGAARFFELLEGQYGKRSIAFFQTHPSPANRVAEIRRRIRDVHGGGPPDPMRSTPELDHAIARARAILPCYLALEEALTGSELAPVCEAAERGIAELPHHAAFHFWMGIALSLEDRREEALPYLRRAAILDRSNFLVPLSHCILEIAVGDPRLAEVSATRTIELLPILPPPWFVRGAARLRLGRPTEAHADFDAGLERVDPSDRDKALAKLREVDPSYEPSPATSSAR